MTRSRKQDAAEQFRQNIRRSNELHREYLEDENDFSDFQRFADWQYDYLLGSFNDLYSKQGYKEAIDFIISDLAGANISARDRDLERAEPVITRMLPLRALETTASAAELNARVIAFNVGICQALQVDGKLPERITEHDYQVASRKASSFDECVELVHLTTEIGRTLSSLVENPLLGRLLRVMRAPARAAGFAALQAFLETGFSTFQQIPDVDHFLDEIERRTIEIYRKVFTAPLTAH